MPETNQSKASSITIPFQTCAAIPRWSTASTSFYFPPLVLTGPVTASCVFQHDLLHQINHARNNHLSSLCLPVMLQAVCLGAFPPEPKALTFSHQQPALKCLSLCSNCAPGGKEEWKPPVTELAFCLFDEWFNLSDTNPPSCKENFCFFKQL